MEPLLLFGDVFRFEEKEYIYLSPDGDYTYAARILEIDETKDLDRLLSQIIRKNGNINGTVFCFVKLRTEGFENRSALLAEAGRNMNSSPLVKLSVEVDPDDLKEIKKQIETDRRIPAKLKECVKDVVV